MRNGRRVYEKAAASPFCRCFSIFPAFYQKTGAGIAGAAAVFFRVGVIRGNKGLKSPDFNTLGRAYLWPCRNPRA